MAHQAIVYGRIQEAWEGTAAGWPLGPEYNRAVLEGLPDGDDRWPFLTRHLFAVASRPLGGASERGWYRGSVIHFAASLKDDPGDPGWPERFLAKLEELVLKRLLWASARVHCESVFFGERAFLYEADEESLGDVRSELREVRFGERILGEVRWARREVQGFGGDPRWLC